LDKSLNDAPAALARC